MIFYKVANSMTKGLSFQEMALKQLNFGGKHECPPLFQTIYETLLKIDHNTHRSKTYRNFGRKGKEKIITILGRRIFLISDSN